MSRDYLEGLSQLHEIGSLEERRAIWRQSLVTLANAIGDQRRPVPLEGLDPEQLIKSVRVAIEEDLIDEIDFLSPPASAVAIYELATALPPGAEKRTLGRRVIRNLRRGDGSTFVAVATQLALGSRRLLSGASVRARVALSLDLPIGTGTRADELALALISRRDLAHEWLRVPAAGSLPSRRLAARLLERAAREAARRAVDGDDTGVRVFQTRTVEFAWNRLLSDRESLVWRHVAAARGLLSVAVKELGDQIIQNLDPSLSITEWRRAAASLGASIAVRPEAALTECERLLNGPLVRRDRGIAAAMIFGLPRAAEMYPDSVESLLEHLVRTGGIEAAEALVELRNERIQSGFGDWAARRARAQIREAMDLARSTDDGLAALMQSIADDLTPNPEQPTLRQMLWTAMDAFVERGAEEAFHLGQDVLSAVEAKLALLERCTDEERSLRQSSFRALRELDLAILERDTLANLLILGGPSADPRETARPLGDIFQRLTNWLVIHEGDPILDEEHPHTTQRARRLRTILHNVDADGEHVDDRADLLKHRRLLAANVLFDRTKLDQSSMLRRTLCAAAGRAGDALVREGVAEVSDVVLAVGRSTRSHHDVVAIAESSMVPDVESALLAYADLERALERSNERGGTRDVYGAMKKLAQRLPIALSPRVEALRATLADLARALNTLGTSASLTEIVENQDSPLASLESALDALDLLLVGADRRLGRKTSRGVPTSGPAIRALGVEVERALREEEGVDLDEAAGGATDAVRVEYPRAIAETVALALTHVADLPRTTPLRKRIESVPLHLVMESPLPSWMPPGRTLGGFYVTRPIATGAVGSVFVARRFHERTREDAEQFALKVPEYTGAAARTLSEGRFMQLFREEAGALLSLPTHSNIARFVTFDAGARPKPILVMELVQGQNLERMLETRDMDMARALELLDGISAGLEAMHSVGVGHLDLKPSNIIMRDQGEPVLVDFGLAGRNIRPGCGTAEYGAPEVWGVLDDDHTRALPADVYSFACLSYEMMTGRVLFDGPDDVAMITKHATHDGLPQPVNWMTTDPRTNDLARLLKSALRRDPAKRTSIANMRNGLAEMRPMLSQLRWPLGAG